MFDKIIRLISDPIYYSYRLQAKIDRKRLLAKYSKLARLAGFKKLYFVLSLDCDTLDDIKVVEDLHSRLMAMGVNPVYAVPGELLKKGEIIYRRISDFGGEFINHGYREHTYFDSKKGEYASCFFYDQLSLTRIREDIIKGDACLKETLGITAQGFRLPHFGTYNKADQLQFVHSILQELGYRFSSSTAPVYAFRYGPIFRKFGVWEIPVSGMASFL